MPADDEPFVLYNCTHISSLSQLVGLRLTRHRNARAVLLIFENDYGVDDALESGGIFDLVIRYDKDFGSDLRENIRETLHDYYSGILGGSNICPERATAIYTGCDYFNIFALHLALEGIRFCNIELCTGQFDDVGRRTDRTKTNSTNTTISEEINDLQFRTGIIDGHGNFDTIECGDDGECTDSLVDFVSLFDRISEDDKHRIRSSLDMNADLSEVQLILMSSWNYCAYSTVFGTDGYMHMFQLIADYCCDPDIKTVVKQHPHDRITMDAFFPGATVMNKNLPVEFLLFHDDLRVRTVFGADTSAATKIRHRISCDRSMGRGSFHLSQYFHHLYVTERAMAEMGLGNILKTHITDNGQEESKCMNGFFDDSLSVSYCGDNIIGPGESIIVSEKFIPALDRQANYFLVDNEGNGWTEYLQNNDMGLVRISVRVTGREGFRGLELDNSIYLLSNNVERIPDGYCKELVNSSATLSVKYECIRPPSSGTGGIDVAAPPSPVPELAFDIARAYRSGRNVARNNQRALEYFRYASSNPWAVTEWFDAAFEERRRQPISEELVNRLIALSTDDSGAGYACRYRLAKLYTEGIGVERDLEKAEELFRSSSRVNPWAVTEWFDAAFEGRDRQPISEELVNRLIALSENDSDVGYSCRYRLAKLYAEGIGVERDLEKAEKLFRSSSRMDKWAAVSWFYHIRRYCDSEIPDDLAELMVPLSAEGSDTSFHADHCLGIYYSKKGPEYADLAVKHLKRIAPVNQEAESLCARVMNDNGMLVDKESCSVAETMDRKEPETAVKQNIFQKIRKMFSR